VIAGSALPSNLAFAAYAIFVAFTIRLVRRLPVEPGARLGRRAVRRALVALIVLICLDFAFGPALLSGAGALLFLVLVLCNFALGRATSRIASAGPGALDERQEALRNRAFRVAYAVFALVVGGGTLVAYTASLDSRAWLASRLSGGAILVFLQLLFFLPTMAVAWLEPDRLTDEPAPPRPMSPGERLSLVMVTVAFLVPLVLSFMVALLPVRTSASVQPIAGMPDHCQYFHAEKHTGFVFEGVQQLNAVACADGVKAYETWGLNQSDCLPGTRIAVEIVTTRCTRTTATDGTLRFTYSAQVRSVFLPFLSRDVTLNLTLARDGRVVRFP
jgi:hypothetical protein